MTLGRAPASLRAANQSRPRGCSLESVSASASFTRLDFISPTSSPCTPHFRLPFVAMLSRGVVRAVAAAPRNGLRAFSSTALQQSNTPSMGDISPSSTTVDSFNKKQQQFREQLADAQKEREARAFARQNTAASSEPVKTVAKETNEQTGQTADAQHPEPDRKSGPLTNLIYGTKEGREMDAQIEASFSQVLARGKYVHSIVFHQVKPDKVEEYVKLVGEWYPKMANLPSNKVHLVGSWRTEVGDCDTFGMCKDQVVQGGVPR